MEESNQGRSSRIAELARIFEENTRRRLSEGEGYRNLSMPRRSETTEYVEPIVLVDGSRLLKSRSIGLRRSSIFMPLAEINESRISYDRSAVDDGLMLPQPVLIDGIKQSLNLSRSQLKRRSVRYIELTPVNSDEAGIETVEPEQVVFKSSTMKLEQTIKPEVGRLLERISRLKTVPIGGLPPVAWVRVPQFVDPGARPKAGVTSGSRRPDRFQRLSGPVKGVRSAEPTSSRRLLTSGVDEPVCPEVSQLLADQEIEEERNKKANLIIDGEAQEGAAGKSGPSEPSFDASELRVSALRQPEETDLARKQRILSTYLARQPDVVEEASAESEDSSRLESRRPASEPRGNSKKSDSNQLSDPQARDSLDTKTNERAPRGSSVRDRPAKKVKVLDPPRPFFTATFIPPPASAVAPHKEPLTSDKPRAPASEVRRSSAGNEPSFKKSFVAEKLTVEQPDSDLQHELLAASLGPTKLEDEALLSQFKPLDEANFKEEEVLIVQKSLKGEEEEEIPKVRAFLKGDKQEEYLMSRAPVKEEGQTSRASLKENEGEKTPDIPQPLEEQEGEENPNVQVSPLITGVLSSENPAALAQPEAKNVEHIFGIDSKISDSSSYLNVDPSSDELNPSRLSQVPAELNSEIYRNRQKNPENQLEKSRPEYLIKVTSPPASSFHETSSRIRQANPDLDEHIVKEDIFSPLNTSYDNNQEKTTKHFHPETKGENPNSEGTEVGRKNEQHPKQPLNSAEESEEVRPTVRNQLENSGDEKSKLGRKIQEEEKLIPVYRNPSFRNQAEASKEESSSKDQEKVGDANKGKVENKIEKSNSETEQTGKNDNKDSEDKQDIKHLDVQDSSDSAPQEKIQAPREASSEKTIQGAPKTHLSNEKNVPTNEKPEDFTNESIEKTLEKNFEKDRLTEKVSADISDEKTENDSERQKKSQEGIADSSDKKIRKEKETEEQLEVEPAKKLNLKAEKNTQKPEDASAIVSEDKAEKEKSEKIEEIPELESLDNIEDITENAEKIPVVTSINRPEEYSQKPESVPVKSSDNKEDENPRKVADVKSEDIKSKNIEKVPIISSEEKPKEDSKPPRKVPEIQSEDKSDKKLEQTKNVPETKSAGKLEEETEKREKVSNNITENKAEEKPEKITIRSSEEKIDEKPQKMPETKSDETKQEKSKKSENVPDIISEKTDDKEPKSSVSEPFLKSSKKTEEDSKKPEKVPNQISEDKAQEDSNNTFGNSDVEHYEKKAEEPKKTSEEENSTQKVPPTFKEVPSKVEKDSNSQPRVLTSEPLKPVAEESKISEISATQQPVEQPVEPPTVTEPRKKKRVTILETHGPMKRASAEIQDERTSPATPFMPGRRRIAADLISPSPAGAPGRARFDLDAMKVPESPLVPQFRRRDFQAAPPSSPGPTAPTGPTEMGRKTKLAAVEKLREQSIGWVAPEVSGAVQSRDPLKSLLKLMVVSKGTAESVPEVPESEASEVELRLPEEESSGVKESLDFVSLYSEVESIRAERRRTRLTRQLDPAQSSLFESRWDGPSEDVGSEEGAEGPNAEERKRLFSPEEDDEGENKEKSDTQSPAESSRGIRLIDGELSEDFRRSLVVHEDDKTLRTSLRFFCCVFFASTFLWIFLFKALSSRNAGLEALVSSNPGLPAYQASYDHFYSSFQQTSDDARSLSSRFTRRKDVQASPATFAAFATNLQLAVKAKEAVTDGLLKFKKVLFDMKSKHFAREGRRLEELDPPEFLSAKLNADFDEDQEVMLSQLKVVDEKAQRDLILAEAQKSIRSSVESLSKYVFFVREYGNKAKEEAQLALRTLDGIYERSVKLVDQFEKFSEQTRRIFFFSENVFRLADQKRSKIIEELQANHHERQESSASNVLISSFNYMTLTKLDKMKEIRLINSRPSKTICTVNIDIERNNKFAVQDMELEVFIDKKKIRMTKLDFSYEIGKTSKRLTSVQMADLAIGVHNVEVYLKLLNGNVLVKDAHMECLNFVNFANLPDEDFDL